MLVGFLEQGFVEVNNSGEILGPSRESAAQKVIFHHLRRGVSPTNVRTSRERLTSLLERSTLKYGSSWQGSRLGNLLSSNLPKY